MIDKKRFMTVAGIQQAKAKESNFNPGKPRKLTLLEVFDDYDLSHDMLSKSDIGLLKVCQYCLSQMKEN